VRRLGPALVGLLLVAAAPVGTPSGTIEVAVANVRNASGQVKVDVCTRDTFLKDCPWSGRAPAHAGTVIVEVHGVPPGQYAIQAFHDANNNGICDQGLFGIPREGVGFSNDALRGFSRPKFDNAAFNFNGGHLRLTLTLRHMLG
jgi:uncharacterized protein (DUF2141 family)